MALPRLPIPWLSIALLLALATLPAGGSGAHELRPCETGDGGRDTRVYLDCLGAALKSSEEELARAVSASFAAIEANGALADAQRRRWTALLDEAQGRFMRWRDFECQSIAPYESGDETVVGGRRAGIGLLSERMRCLLRHNLLRAEDLTRRYPPPANWVYRPAEPSPPPAQAAATPGVRIISP